MTPKYGAGQRHVLACISCIGFFNLYTTRVSTNVAIVAMVDRYINDTSRAPEANASVADSECGNSVSVFSANATDLKRGEFVWSRSTQELILSSFYYGYVTLQIPAGWLAERYGAKHLIGVSVLGCSLFSLLVPIAARHAVELMVVVRVIQGLFQGLAFPSMHVMWSKWAPPLERGKLVTFSYAGGMIGTVVAMPLSGLLCEYGFDGGWPSVYYVFGMVGILWYACWIFLAAESPRVHPRITNEEQKYIELTVNRNPTKQVSFFSLPWLKFFTSPPFIAIMAVQFCHNWGFSTMLTNLPSYMKQVLGFDIKENGVLSAMPYLAHWVFVIVGGTSVDYLVKKKLLKPVNARKLANAVGLVTPAVCLVAAGHAGCNPWAAVALFITGVGINGATAAGYQSNHLDIAPKYAGTLMGIANTVGNMAGVAAPLVVAAVLKETNHRSNWLAVFYISAAAYVLGTVLYTAMAADSVQKWAEESQATELQQQQELLLQEKSKPASPVP